jgi:dynein assembly factor 1
MATIQEVPPPTDQTIDSEQGEAGTHSDLNQSIDSSHENSSLQNHTEETDSNAPLSSRGSTRATGDDDTMSFATIRRADDSRYRHHFYGTEEADEREEDGSLVLSNRYLWEMFKREPKKYYRTPSLNDKLYLHYKGFSYIRNLEQFTELKCLYFEGNGCKSMKGLEQNTMLRSLFIQENIIETIEGLDTLKELRQLNLNENMIKKVTGLAGCEKLDTIYLKRNRIGKDEAGDVESLKGLLERPTISCLDLQDNYISDPAILEEVLYKLPNLSVLYLQNNPVTKRVDNYRKTLISKIPTLKYLDDRPVFEEDRRRAEAFARGGMEEERKEIKRIKKEKDDKHWANHEAFRLMVNKAKEEKKSKEQQDKEAQDYKKSSLKEMMAAARIARDAGYDQKKILERSALDGSYVYEKNDIQKANEFYDDLQKKTEERYQEKKDGVEHKEDVE